MILLHDRIQAGWNFRKGQHPFADRGSLAEASTASLFHVKVEVIFVGVIGLWPKHGAEFMTGFIVHMLYELGLSARGRVRSDRGR